MDKPHKGRITSVERNDCEGYGLGYYLTCRFVDHPLFARSSGHTSYLVKDEHRPGLEPGEEYEIETRNSRYTVVV